MIRAYVINDGNETNIGTFSGNESFTVPAVAYGKDIYFEVTPVSTTGGIGTAATSSAVAVAKTNILTFADGVATAYSPEASAKILFATYSEKELVDVEVVDASFTDYKFTCEIPETLEAGETMKVMMWKDLANITPLCTSVN